MRLVFNGRKDHGPREVQLLRRDLLPGQVEVDNGCGVLTVQMSARVTTHIEGNYDVRVELSRDAIAILARAAFGLLPFEMVVDCLSSQTISARVRSSAK
jgi:hypothetical protein